MIKDYEIRNALKLKIKEALDLYYDNANPTVQPKIDVNIYPNWVLAHRNGDSAALLRVTTGRDAGKVHTWMIGSGAFDRTRPERHGKDLVAYATTGLLKKKGSNRRDVVKSFRVWAYLEYSEGTAGNEDIDNSENLLTNEVDFVSRYLSKYPDLGITDITFQGHGELQAEDIDIINYGDVVANVAFMSIDVVVFDDIS
jgi:hypothetical protein